MKPFIAFIILIASASCIDSYTPDIKDYKSLLVIEGLLTNENSSYVFRLSRTMDDEGDTPEMITDALLYLTDEENIRTDFQNFNNGIYKTDSTLFTGQVGKTYTLHILTSDGLEYVSDPCTMYPVADIDSVYYEKGMEIMSDLGETVEGIRIYIDSGDSEEDAGYLRWEYNEVWKIRIPSPQKFIYISDSLIIPLDDVKDYCWKTNKSNDIRISSFSSRLEGEISREPLMFIGSERSDRLTLRYSLLVKQYSISDKEYEFWENLKEINESGGDIFDSQPFPVYGNIHNINDPDEMVLGYFEVSAVASKRIYITPVELDDLKIPNYKSDCTTFPVSPEDYKPASSQLPLMTFDQLFQMFMYNDKYTFIEPIYNTITRQLEKLVFAYNSCSVCEPYGTTVSPDFWIDAE